MDRAIRDAAPSDRLRTFIEAIQLSAFTKDKLDRITSKLEAALQKSPQLTVLEPQLYRFGSLATGLALYDSSDIDVVCWFDRQKTIAQLDYDTAMLALKAVQRVLVVELGLLQKQDQIMTGRRCPILKLDFSKCLPSSLVANLKGITNKFAQCDLR